MATRFIYADCPNLDGSFTVTLFLSHDEGEYNFNNLTTPEMVMAFFKKEFPDALELMPNLVDDFFKNPTSPLGTVKCSPWHYKGNTLLMGDAAHAIVPFYGQGMNASFEDVVEFDNVLETHKNPTSKREMKEHVSHDLFREKRDLEMALEKNFPNDYASKYSLVTFNENIGYREAMLKGRAQDKAILNMLVDHEIDLNGNLKQILDKVNAETQEILDEDNIAGLNQ